MRPHVEKMITLGKRGDLSARRLAGSYLMTRESVSRLFETVAPRFRRPQRRLFAHHPQGMRQGDGASTCYIELLGSEKVIEAKRAKRRKSGQNGRKKSASKWKKSNQLRQPNRAAATKRKNSPSTLHSMF